MLLADIQDKSRDSMAACPRSGEEGTHNGLPQAPGTAFRVWFRGRGSHTLVEIGSVVVLFVELAKRFESGGFVSTYLTTGHTTTTRMLSVLADTSEKGCCQYRFGRVDQFVVTYPLPAET